MQLLEDFIEIRSNGFLPHMQHEATADYQQCNHCLMIAGQVVQIGFVFCFFAVLSEENHADDEMIMDLFVFVHFIIPFAQVFK